MSAEHNRFAPEDAAVNQSNPEETDALSDYLSLIATYKVLTREQELRLGIDIKAAQSTYEWLSDISDNYDGSTSPPPKTIASIKKIVEKYTSCSMLIHPTEHNPNHTNGISQNGSRNNNQQIQAYTPKPEDITSALDLLKMGKRSYECLVNSNLKLVVSVAKKYHFDTPLLDLIQMGNLGLLKAAARFNPELGWKFSTYAVWWIRQSIEREVLNTAAFIREPIHFVSLRNRAQKAKNAHLVEHGAALTSTQLAEMLGVSTDAIDAVDMYSAHEPLSLDNPMSAENDDITWESSIPSTDYPVEDQAVQTHLHSRLNEILKNTLTERQRRVLELRFGLLDNKPRTLEEIGEIYEVTRERVRQIESKAMSKLRRHRNELKLFR